MHDISVEKNRTSEGSESHSVSDRGPVRPPVNGTLEEPTLKSRSLYDDTLSEKRGSKPWSTLVWAIIGLIVIGGMVAAFIGRSPDPRITGEEGRKSREVDSTSPLSQVVDEIRSGKETESSEEDPLESSSAVRETDSAPAIAQESRGAPPQERAPSTQNPPSSRSADPRPSSQGEKQTEGKTENVAGAVSKPQASESGVAGVLEQSEPAIPEALPEPPEPVEPAIPAEDVEAFEVLQTNSPEAGRLIKGEYGTLEFRSWRVVQKTPAEIWIDVIAAWTSGGEEVHFIWSVNRKNGAIRALSEAARNLK